MFDEHLKRGDWRFDDFYFRIWPDDPEAVPGIQKKWIWPWVWGWEYTQMWRVLRLGPMWIVFRWPTMKELEK